MMPRNKIAKDAAIFTKGNVKGAVNFPPFERLDEASLLKTCKYNVFPLGKIQDYCRHIPYNSGKKDFFDKTGRESFEGKYAKVPVVKSRASATDCTSFSICLQGPR